MSEQRRYTIKQLPPELRPRERLLEAGPAALSDGELLGLLFGIGSREKTAVELAGEVISEAGGLHGLYHVNAHELMEVKGIGAAKACILLAAVELGRRIGQVRNPERPMISSPADVDRLLRGRIANLDRENFIAVLLNAKNEVIGGPFDQCRHAFRLPRPSPGGLQAGHPGECGERGARAQSSQRQGRAQSGGSRSHQEARGVRRDTGYRGARPRYRGRWLL